MKTKKMLFKAAVCLMAVMFVFSSVSALAAEYVTYTTYDLDADLATVKTVVVGASGEVAYLAYNGDNPETEGAIFHIDQTTGTGNDVFEYTVDAEKIAASQTHSILVGTQTEGALEATPAALGTDYTLTVNFAGCKVVLRDTSNPEVADNTVTLETSGTVKVGNGNALVFEVTDVDTTYDASKVTAKLDDVAFDGTVIPTITGNAVLNITLGLAERDTEISEEEEAPTAAEKIVSVTDEYVNQSGDAIAVKKLTKFGKVALGTNGAADIIEYGIIISDDQGSEPLKVVGGGNELLEQTDGVFAIIVEGLDDEFEGTIKVKTFVTTANGTSEGVEYTYTDAVE